MPAIQGINNKLDALNKLSQKNGFKLSRIFYVGNDINDYEVMKHCGISACPSDSHSVISSIATFKLSKKGGEGIVRDLLENVFNINLIKILYSEGF